MSLIVELMFLPLRIAAGIATLFFNMLPDDPTLRVGVMLAIGIFARIVMRRK
jgi:hypothetical protein